MFFILGTQGRLYKNLGSEEEKMESDFKNQYYGSKVLSRKVRRLFLPSLQVNYPKNKIIEMLNQDKKYGDQDDDIRDIALEINDAEVYKRLITYMRNNCDVWLALKERIDSRCDSPSDLYRFKDAENFNIGIKNKKMYLPKILHNENYNKYSAKWDKGKRLYLIKLPKHLNKK
ncbi:unnamed protein product [Gordionus sp. m RMFG-2023]